MRFGESGVLRPAPLRRARIADPVIIPAAKPRRGERIVRAASAAGALLCLGLLGAYASGVRLTSPPPFASLRPASAATAKGQAEAWLLERWLPTVLEPPYRASAICSRARLVEQPAWACVVRQTGTDRALPQSAWPRWRVRVVGSQTLGFRAIRRP